MPDRRRRRHNAVCGHRRRRGLGRASGDHEPSAGSSGLSIQGQRPLQRNDAGWSHDRELDLGGRPERRHALLDCISRPARRTPASQSSLDERTLRRFPAARHVHQHDRLAEETLGTQVPAQAVYFSASQARSGTTATPLTGTRSYAIRFPAGHLPPHGSDGFWSITLYNAAGSLAANPIDRYSIGDETPGLVIGADGSLTIVVSASRPSETDVNWLPAPRGAFTRRFLVPARNPGDQLNRDGRA